MLVCLSESCTTHTPDIPVYAFFFYCYGAHRDLHSFPTRRSSDLVGAGRSLQRSLLHRLAPNSRNRRAHGARRPTSRRSRSEEHTSELQSHSDLVCRLLLEKKKKETNAKHTTHQAITHNKPPHKPH